MNDQAPIQTDELETVRPIIADVLCVAPEWVERDQLLADAPSYDSLDIVELQMACEDSLAIELADHEMERVKTCGDLAALCSRKLADKR